MPDPISRRAFFGQAAAAPVAGLIAAYAPPKAAWTIVALNWEYNDEFNYSEGERPLGQLFYDKEMAEAECRKLNAGFFEEEDPDLFAPEHYLHGSEFSDCDNDDEASRRALWARMVEGGFPDPYYVLELAQPQPAEEER